MYHVSGCCCLFVPLFLHFSFSPIFNIEIFCHTFLGNCETLKIETWLYTWTVGRCIMYTGIRLLLLIHPLSSFFFLSNYQTLKFLSHFSQELWGLEDWNLVHTWIVGRCILYTGIRLLLLICPFFLHFLSLQFSNIKIFRHTLLMNCEA